MVGVATEPDFWERTRAAVKVMVLDLGFLGDTVHLMPALWVIRQAYPQAQLHVIVAEHVTSLMECAPWVDCVWGYPRFPKHASLVENIRTVSRLRRERFDVVINLNGSDRSSWLTWLSGARERLGQLPPDGGPWLWRSLFTEVVENPFSDEPPYVQKCHCLNKCGFPATRPEFHVEIPNTHLQAAGITLGDAGTYFHVSPFTKTDEKELPLDKTAEMIEVLQEEFPDKKLVVSCAPDELERCKMDALLARLKKRPWRVLTGKLSLVQLAALIQRSAVHLSGDTGTLHLAMMTGVPTVSWFRTDLGMKGWIPAGPHHRTILGSGMGPDSFREVDPADLVTAVKAVVGQTHQLK